MLPRLTRIGKFGNLWEITESSYLSKMKRERIRKERQKKLERILNGNQ